MIELSLEQQFQLRELRLRLARMSREELIEMVLDEREDFLLQTNYYREMMRDMGMDVSEVADMSLVLPETEEDMIKHFGHVPSDEEVAALISERIEACQEAARMDVDIEAIVLGVDE
jgi:vacuolar-type H+-ATPase catalytic subunit A/Vma1